MGDKKLLKKHCIPGVLKIEDLNGLTLREASEKILKVRDEVRATVESGYPANLKVEDIIDLKIAVNYDYDGAYLELNIYRMETDKEYEARMKAREKRRLRSLSK